MRGVSGPPTRLAGTTETAVSLSVFGAPLEVRIAASDQPTRLADMVPLARRLADEIATRAAEHCRSAGGTVPCDKGCSACCKYLVPVSTPEAARLGEDLAALPAPMRQLILNRFADTMEHISQAGKPETQPAEAPASAVLASAGRWYANLEMNCPLLADDVCTMYDQRPIACRQHLVSSPAEHCRGYQAGLGEVVHMPVDVSHALALLAAEMEGTDTESVVLSLAPHWLDANSRRSLRTWPLSHLTECFFDILRELAE